MAWLIERKIVRDLPEEWGGIVPTEVFTREALKIVEEGSRDKLTCRIMGGIAISIHSMDFREFASKLERVGTGVAGVQEFSDIDFMAYKKQRGKITEFFEKLGYVKRKATLSSATSERQIYYHPRGWFYVDVFFDKLEVANHPIDFRERLELDSPTITVADLLLEKIQIWEAFSQKDLKDCLVLLRAHKVGDEDRDEIINAKYIADLTSGDWGFWYTATTNLKRIKKFVEHVEELGDQSGIKPYALSDEDKSNIDNKIDEILKRIEDRPKSFKWKMRSKVGTAKAWYKPVERPETVGGFLIWEALSEKEE